MVYTVYTRGKKFFDHTEDLSELIMENRNNKERKLRIDN
jgi:hypothetical protein